MQFGFGPVSRNLYLVMVMVSYWILKLIACIESIRNYHIANVPVYHIITVLIVIKRLTLSTMSWRAVSARLINLIQWWIRPGPKRPWAISNPRPSPNKMLVAGTRTLSNRTSACPSVRNKMFWFLCFFQGTEFYCPSNKTKLISMC